MKILLAKIGRMLDAIEDLRGLEHDAPRREFRKNVSRVRREAKAVMRYWRHIEEKDWDPPQIYAIKQIISDLDASLTRENTQNGVYTARLDHSLGDNPPAA